MADPIHADRVLSELLDVHIDAVAAACEVFGVPRDAWPDVPDLRRFALSLAVVRRVERLMDAGETRFITSAIAKTALAFGISRSACRSTYYRAKARAREAQDAA